MLKPSTGVVINNQHPLGKNLVACWLFNEGGGTTIHDLTSYKNNGIGTNMSLSNNWIFDRDGYAINFDGVSNYVVVGNIPKMNFTESDSFTIYSSFRSSSSGTSERNLIRSDKSSGVRNLFLLAVSNSNKIDIRIGRTTETLGAVTGTINVSDDKIHTMAFVRNTNKDTLALYDNGIKDVEVTDGSTGVWSLDQPYNIGNWPEFNIEFFEGNIHFIMAWNRALTTNEIIQLQINPYRMLKQGIDLRKLQKSILISKDYPSQYYDNHIVGFNPGVM